MLIFVFVPKSVIITTLTNMDWTSLKTDDIDEYAKNITDYITKLAAKQIYLTKTSKYENQILFG